MANFFLELLQPCVPSDRNSVHHCVIQIAFRSIGRMASSTDVDMTRGLAPFPLW